MGIRTCISMLRQGVFVAPHGRSSCLITSLFSMLPSPVVRVSGTSFGSLTKFPEPFISPGTAVGMIRSAK